MRRAARVDANQATIVAGLTQAGASVVSLAAIGQGVPDLLVGFRGNNYLLEIKDGDKVPSAQKLNKDQQAFFYYWGGQVRVVTSLENAYKVIGANVT